MGSVWHESIVTAVEHEPGIILDEWNCVAVEISEHRVAFPATNNSNVIGVNAREEEGHGTTGTERACCNVCRIHSSMTGDGERRCAEQAGYHSAGDAAAVSRVGVINVERSSTRSTVKDEVGYLSEHGTNGARVSLPVDDVS